MASNPLSFPHSGFPVNRSKSLFLTAWVPVLLCLCVFAVESTPYLGTDHTSGPLRRMCEMFVGSSADYGWTFTHHILRKIGHFSGYGMLSVVCFRGGWMTLRKAHTRWGHLLGSHAIALGATILVASADEIHQSFLPNRTGMFSDVVLDTCGGLASQTLLSLVMMIRFAMVQSQGYGLLESMTDSGSPIKIRRRMVMRRMPVPLRVGEFVRRRMMTA
jgi:hypothetical protein